MTIVRLEDDHREFWEYSACHYWRGHRVRSFLESLVLDAQVLDGFWHRCSEPVQALGSYQGGRMLFLGLGAGLGSAMIVDGMLEPMELAHLPYKDGNTYEDYVGSRGLKRLGKKNWRAATWPM